MDGPWDTIAQAEQLLVWDLKKDKDRHIGKFLLTYLPVRDI